MDKFIKTLIICLIFSSLGAFAMDIVPRYVESIKHKGIGFVEVKSPLIIRIEPDENSELLERVDFDYNDNIHCMKNKNCSMSDIFVSYSKERKIAFLTALDEQGDWNQVCFNSKTKPLCGWVDSDDDVFYSLGEFYNDLGRKYGLYLFKDVDKADKILYSAPTKQTNSTGTIEMPRAIFPWLIRGNWLLVKVSDFDNKQKTGWINFRDDLGTLKLFVKF